MDDDAAVAEERSHAFLGRGVEFEIEGLETGGIGRDSDGAMLAAQIADLARLGLGGVAGGRFATFVGVKMAESAGAVAIGGHWGDVNVIN